MDGLDHLLKLLAILKSDGLDAAISRDVHYGGDVQNADFQTYQEPLRSLRHSLEESKYCMAALNTIKARLAKKIRNLQQRSAPLVLEDGIQRVPDEILAHIFEAGHQMSEHSEFALRVSHVSHRFREVSLRTPLLWTRLSSKLPNDQTEAYLTRSSQMGLQVTLYENYGDESISALRLMGTHSDRWSRLILLMPPDDQEIIEEVGLTHFPRLRSIFHKFNIKPTGLQWHMPLLSQLDGYFAHLPRDVSFPFLSQLTSTELGFSEHGSFDMSSLAHVLYRMSNLRNLSLSFQNCKSVHIDTECAREPPKPQTFPIDSLKITFRASIGIGVVTSLYAVLEYLLPSLLNISLLMDGDLSDFLTGAGIFHYSSTIRLWLYYPYNLTSTINLLLRHCKFLRSLQIENSSFNEFTAILFQWPHSPSLRHIQFRHCVIPEECFEDMVRSLLAHEDFQSIEIISPHKISEKFLLDLQDEVGERLKLWL